MAKAKRKTLPKEFDELLAVGDIPALKAVFDTCQLDARGGVFRQVALAFTECPDELARWLVAQGADISARDQYGDTPLHARAGNWRASVDLLIELGADVNDDAGGRGTPLHRAADVGNMAAIQALLANGARADAANGQGQTPLVYALQRCSNAGIDRIVPVAETLLAALPAKAPPEPKSFLGRLFGGGKEREAGTAMTPEMQEYVTRIGTTFEFHRAGFNPEMVEVASNALDRLYALFNVPPVPRRALHDGKSAIHAKAGSWQDQHQELWELLVPSSGAAQTVQGEVVRLAGRITDEIERNGGANWDRDHTRMADALRAYLGSGTPLPDGELAVADQLIAEAKGKGGDPAQLCRLAVAWVELNPKPVALAPPSYNR